MRDGIARDAVLSSHHQEVSCLMVYGIPYRDLLKAGLSILDRYKEKDQSEREAWILWILDLCDRNLPFLSETDWRNLMTEAAAFTHLSEHYNSKSQFSDELEILSIYKDHSQQSVLVDRGHDGHKLLYRSRDPEWPPRLSKRPEPEEDIKLIIEEEEIPLPSKKELLEFQELIRCSMPLPRSLDGDCTVPDVEIRTIIFRDTPWRGQKKIVIVEEPAAGDFIARATHQLRGLLVQYGPKISRCPAHPDSRGGKLFLKSRSGKVYCSLRCQSRMSSQRNREKSRKQEGGSFNELKNCQI